MSAFLTVNGVELGDSISEPGGIKESRREIGETSSAFDGTLRKSRQSIKHDMELETTPMVSATALAWESYLRGLGEHWSFDSSLYGSKGLGPSASTDAAVSATQKKFGAKSLKLTGTTGTITFTANAGAAYTLAFWHYNGSGWDHWIYLAGPTLYKNGSSSAIGPSGLTVTPSATTMVLAPSGATDQYVDDVVILPFAMPAAWAPSWGAATSAFSDLPKLTIAGDAVPEAATRSVMGEATPRFVKAVIGGSLVSNGKVLAVTLSEV